MLAGGGVRTRATLRAYLATWCSQAPPPPSPPAGYWQQWQREMNERDQLWEEAQLRLKAQRVLQDEEWRHIRAQWAQGATSQPPKEKVKWWWEGGQHRASAEQTAAWQRQFERSGGAAQDARVDKPRHAGDSRGHYAALGHTTAESRRADSATLQAAFNKIVLANHPDTATGADEEARTKRFRAAVAAWDVLRDKALRDRYDREGAAY